MEGALSLARRGARFVRMVRPGSKAFPEALRIFSKGWAGFIRERSGSILPGIAPSNIYRCKDGRYVHFTTNMPHMWREFAQNWMTDKVLAGPEWENPKYRDAHSEEVSKAFAPI